MRSDSIGESREHHRKRIQTQKASLEEKRCRILQCIDKAAEVLKDFGANQVLICGSILNPKRFHFRSDLDLIVYGMPPSLLIKAYLAVEAIKELEDIEIDLKHADELPKEFLASVEAEGKRIL